METKKPFELAATGVVTIRHSDVEQAALVIGEACAEAHLEVIPAMFGAALAAIRLANYGIELSGDVERQALKDWNDWVFAYFAPGGQSH